MSNIYIEYQTEDESYIYQEQGGKLVLVARHVIDRLEKFTVADLEERRQEAYGVREEFLASLCEGVIEHVENITKDRLGEPLPKDYHAIMLLIDSTENSMDYDHFGVDTPAIVGGVAYGF